MQNDIDNAVEVEDIAIFRQRDMPVTDHACPQTADSGHRGSWVEKPTVVLRAAGRNGLHRA